MLTLLRKFAGPVLLLLALFVGDQIRINRPDHKYRLTLEVETPDGLKTASGVFAVHPDRGYTQGGKTQTKGDAIALDIAGKPLVVLMAHQDEGKFELDDVNFIAVRAFSAAGQRAVFKHMDRVKGPVPVNGKVRPLMATFADARDPATMRAVNADDLAATFGPNVRLREMTVDIVPNGYWPADFGGALGEPVTRGIASVLPWLNASGDPAAVALAAAGWKPKPGDNARAAFTR